ncbi:prephenate dehydrogenase [Candidatus Poribacteria bacterium]
MTLFERVHRVVIAGVGLIGGSVGLAMKRAGFNGEIVGLGRRWSSLKNALDVGAVDSAILDYAEALGEADLLLIGTPVNTIPIIIEEAIKHTQPGCIITDVGSVKEWLVSKVEPLIPGNMHFVGAHPMAGSHMTSVTAASASLFDDRICIVTPTETTDSEAVKIVTELWKFMGARVEFMSPEEHDRLIAAASHLPHAVASALVSVVAGVESEKHKALDFTATGFEDTTVRIAGGSPELWTDILMQNAGMVSLMLGKLERELAEMRKLLSDMNEQELMEKLEQAKQIRDSIQR